MNFGKFDQWKSKSLKIKFLGFYSHHISIYQEHFVCLKNLLEKGDAVVTVQPKETPKLNLVITNLQI